MGWVCVALGSAWCWGPSGTGVHSSSLHSTILMQCDIDPTTCSVTLTQQLHLHGRRRGRDCDSFLEHRDPGAPIPADRTLQHPSLQTQPCSTLLWDWPCTSIRAAGPCTTNRPPPTQPQPSPSLAPAGGGVTPAPLTLRSAGTVGWMCAGAAVSLSQTRHTEPAAKRKQPRALCCWLSQRLGAPAGPQRRATLRPHENSSRGSVQ